MNLREPTSAFISFVAGPVIHLVEETTALRIGQHDLALLLQRLQRFAHARDRSTRSGATDEGIHSPIRLLPDFRPSALLVSCEVRKILELIGEETTRRIGVVRGVDCRR